MEWSLHKGGRFSKFNDQPDENGAYHLTTLLDFVRKGLETELFSQMVRAFPEFHSEQKRGLPLEVVHNFLKNFLSIWPQTEISGFFG